MGRVLEDRFCSVAELGNVNERKGLGCIVLDEHGRVISLSPLAWLLLTRGGLRIDGDRLVAEDPAQRPLFEATLRRCLQGEESKRVPRLGLRRVIYGGYLFVTAAVIGLRQHGQNEPSVHPLLLLRDSTWIHAREVDELADTFGLTRRESELACHIARGAQLRQFAEERSLSPNTVKTHLKQVFRKLGVHNQVEMVANVLAVLR